MGALRLAELSKHLAANGLDNTVRGNADLLITGCNTLEGAREGEITFLANPKYRDRVKISRASAIIMQEDASVATEMPQLLCEDPYQALTMAVVKIHGYRRNPQWGRHSGAHIADSARIGANPNVGPGATICDEVVIGDNVTIYPGVFVGPNAVLGHDVVLYPNVTIYDGCRLGDRVTIHAGTVIGEDGLGYAPVGDEWMKIPQVGIVIIDDDVEIGSNCTIDRATLGTTRISRGTKFSNLVAVGHGCQIGEDCMIVAQVGMAGSVTVGNHVTVAGQAGIVGHLRIGDNAQICAKAGVVASVDAGSTVLGAPAVPAVEARRQMAALQRLPEMRKRLRDMQRELGRLRKVVDEIAAKPQQQAARDR